MERRRRHSAARDRENASPSTDPACCEGSRNPITLTHADLWTRNLIVVRPSFHFLTWRDFPLNFFGRQLIDLDALLDSRLHWLVTLTCSLCWKGFDSCFMH